MIDLTQVEALYDLLSDKAKNDLDEQFNKQRIKGSEYAAAYSQLMNTIISVCVQAPKIDADAETGKSQVEVNKAHAKMLESQTQGFDDNVNMKLFEAQINTWGMMFSSGMMEEQPGVIKNDEVTSLYTSLKKD